MPNMDISSHVPTFSRGSCGWHITCGGAPTPPVTHPLSHLFIAAWLTAPAPLINQLYWLTNLFSWRKKPANVPPRPDKKRRQHMSLSTGGRQQATLAKGAGVDGPSRHTAPLKRIRGLTAGWTGQRLRTSSHTRSRLAPPSQEPCGHPGSIKIKVN